MFLFPRGQSFLLFKLPVKLFGENLFICRRIISGWKAKFVVYGNFSPSYLIKIASPAAARGTSLERARFPELKAFYPCEQLFDVHDLKIRVIKNVVCLLEHFCLTGAKLIMRDWCTLFPLFQSAKQPKASRFFTAPGAQMFPFHADIWVYWSFIFRVQEIPSTFRIMR